MELGRCTNCNDMVMDLTRKGRERFLANYREHIVEINDVNLMRVAVCDKCKELLISGEFVRKVANNIWAKHQEYWKKEKKGAPNNFAKMKVTDPNSSREKHLRKKLKNEITK